MVLHSSVIASGSFDLGHRVSEFISVLASLVSTQMTAARDSILWALWVFNTCLRLGPLIRVN